MDTNEYFILASLVSFSFYMIISSIRQMKEEVASQKFRKTYPQWGEYCEIVHVNVENDEGPILEEISDENDISEENEDNKYKRLFEFV